MLKILFLWNVLLSGGIDFYYHVVFFNTGLMIYLQGFSVNILLLNSFFRILINISIYLLIAK